MQNLWDGYVQRGVIAETRNVTLPTAHARQWTTTALWATLAIGALVHVGWYLERGSLWFDESLLALNILHRSPAELLDRLWFVQGAPWGFLESEKLSVAIFGAGDQSLRLVSLMAMLAALPLFWHVASLYLGGPVLVLAVALFCLSPFLVQYSAEVKQYALDVLGTLLAIWFGHMALRRMTWRRTITIAMAGGLLVWFSHASMLALGACGAVAGVAAIGRGDYPAIQRVGAIGALWAASVGAFFLTAWPKLSTLRGLGESETYSLQLPTAAGDVKLFLQRTSDIAESPFGLYNRPWGPLIALATTVLIIVGATTLFRRNRWDLALLLAPFVAVAVALALHRYPYAVRFLIFLVPLIVLLVSAGAGVCLQAIRRPGPGRQALAALGVGAAVFLLVVEIVSTTRLLAFNEEGQDIKPVLERVRSEWRSGDVLYLHAAAQYPTRYYAEIDGVNKSGNGEQLWPLRPTYGYVDNAPAMRSAPPSLFVGRYRKDETDSFAADLERFRGHRRVWFIFGHLVVFRGAHIVGDLDSHLALLDSAGRRLETVQGGTALGLLYDLGS